ncbi:MAG: 2-oxo acid dehydrogenase subunit E2 [Bacteroidota bacterium]|nr:2-oxo acid dehydrogenase subunit E2 [Bacteroidota bacterium]
MAQYKLLLPKMGESVAEATIIKWTKKPGDQVEIDDTVMEIATDKVDSEVPSPVSGRLVEQLFKDNDVAQVGAVIAIIETGDPEEIKQQVKPETSNSTREQSSRPEPVEEQIDSVPFTEQPDRNNEAGIQGKTSDRFYSPLVKNIAVQEGISNIELDQIPGRGAEGRLTKDDLLNYIQNKQHPAPAAQHNTAKAAGIPASGPVADIHKPEAAFVSGGDEIIEMDRMRRLIADHMVMSTRTSAHVTSFVEADVTNLVLWREKIKSSFEKREGEKITFTPIFIEAVVKAIKDLPMINISVNGHQIIKKKDINISMATALPSGNLIVPVIKKADQLNLVGITKAVNDLANRARNNNLKPDDVQGGTFTITNVGTFGNVMGTPIINQPQVAILAVGAIRKKPAVIETPQGDYIGIRHMMFLSLSYDHRVVDGALGGMFVKKVADYLENWDSARKI